MTFTALSEIGEYQHVLTIEEMPNHNHSYRTNDAQHSAVGDSGNYPMRGKDSYYKSMTTNETGNSKAHQNIPPSKVVYFWIRKS